jgi:hypothetical protein
VSVLRILIWNLADSMTSLAEVLDKLPEPRDGDEWISNEPQERFGLVSSEDELPDLAELNALIGKEPDIAEEFDVL